MYIKLLKAKAIEKGLIESHDEIDVEKVFQLVRDMPYARASSRDPETIIDEWRGTCSGKHYLLKTLFGELGYSSRVIACTTVSQLNPADFSGKAREMLDKLEGRFVDVHNYLILELPDGDMIVDATFPLAAQDMGLVVNERLIFGEDQKIASEPIQSWDIPDGRDPQDFKDEILKDNFSAEELECREAVILAVSELSMANESEARTMALVMIETPYAGDVERNIEFARACVRDSLNRGEAPLALHLLYTQDGILDDEIPEERRWGIAAGLAWAKHASKTVVYTDLGISTGMEIGIQKAKEQGRVVEYRELKSANP
jgi:hypothetical protein